MVIEGAGIKLRRSFGPTRSNPLDPFWLFDNFAFNNPVEGIPAYFPTRPHRLVIGCSHHHAHHVVMPHHAHRLALGKIKKLAKSGFGFGGGKGFYGFRSF